MYTASEKLAIIRLVEDSEQGITATLEQDTRVCTGTGG
jgi:hypothetical protein